MTSFSYTGGVILKKTGLIIVCLLVGQLVWTATTKVLESRFDISGSDQQAMALVQEIDPSYTPWALPAYEPTALMETILFGIQAFIGGIILIYCTLRLRAQVSPETRTNSNLKK